MSTLQEQLKNFPLPGVSLVKLQIDRLSSFHKLLLEWNERMNLVSRKSIDRAFSIHFVDCVGISLFGLRYGKGPFYDLGSGGGFPGIIFSCLFPEQKITLFERSTKKQTFLQEAVKQLELTQTKIEDEPQGRKKYDGTFFARAVLPDEEFFSYFSTILKKGSFVVFNSGSNRELRVEPTGFQKIEEESYELPNNEGGRRNHLFLFQGLKNSA